MKSLEKIMSKKIASIYSSFFCLYIYVFSDFSLRPQLISVVFTVKVLYLPVAQMTLTLFCGTGRKQDLLSLMRVAIAATSFRQEGWSFYL